jgi:hypothetical protein
MDLKPQIPQMAQIRTFKQFICVIGEICGSNF